jgi:Curli production assembly/transport component CsgG
MKTSLKYIITILIMASAFRLAAEEPLTVAVFDFESKDEGVRDMGPKIATLLNANLSAEPTIITVERAELEKALGEQELGLSGNVSAESAAKVGKLTGAKVLVTGRVFKTDDELVIVAKIIGTETSRVYGEIVKGHGDSSLTDLCGDLAKKIANDVNQKASTLVATAVTRDEEIDKIKKALGHKKRPTVSVHITEQHFGQAVIDPAAQTELSLILEKCGFPLKDKESTDRAQIEITGEAFSEFGLRKGNLQSCRARIEIKVRDHATGELITVDRQTSVAVDIAEHVAAKTALQNGAAELAARILPQLVK